MSFALLFICRRTGNLSPLLLRPLQISPRIFHVELSTFKSKYPSFKPSMLTGQNPFKEPQDEKSRRLKLQEQIRFREKFQLDNDYELIYAMPQRRIYSIMHFVCVFATVAMLVVTVMQFHRDMLDLESITNEINRNIPQYAIYSGAAIIAAMFGGILVLISQIPIRLYYSPVRQSYALFYHPIISAIRQRKIIFRVDQYEHIPHKLDSMDSQERSIKIGINVRQGLFGMKPKFYLIEEFFRSRNDIYRIRTKEIHSKETKVESNKKQQEEEIDIWQTVIENKDQSNDKQRTSQRKTF